MFITAAYDVCGSISSPEQPLVGVGLVATQEGWDRFETEWRSVLQRYGVDYFHATDYAHSVGEYVAWKGDEMKRAAFLRDLVAVIASAVAFGVYSRLVPETWNMSNDSYDLEDEGRGNPYTLSVFRCVYAVEQRIREEFEPSGLVERVVHLIERGDRGQGPLEAVMRRTSSRAAGQIVLMSKRNTWNGDWFHPFSACDLVAYEVSLDWRRELARDARPERRSYRALIENVRLEGAEWKGLGAVEDVYRKREK